MNQKTPYALLGDEKIRELATVFYQVMDENTEAQDIRKMHAANVDEITQKLYEYLVGWMGGPKHLYKEKYGTICLTKPHEPYKITEAHRDQWMMCFREALDRVDAPQEVKDMLENPLLAMADMMRSDRG
jgi:hemoglobin